MKNKLNRTFKFGILFLGMTLLFWNCEKNEEITNKEIQQEKKRSEISFEQFKSNISSKEKLQTFNRFFDINKSSSKTTFNKKNTNDFNDATILTDNIIKIKKNDFTSYTFTILTQTKNYEFYNLVLYVNNNQEIYKSHILKYTPSEKWLADTTQHFSGNVKIINNDFFNVDNLLQSKSSIYAKSLANDDCIDSVTTEWECSFGYNHAPGTCNGTSFEYIITIEYGECPDNGGGNGDFDPETGNEGGSTSGGGDGGIVTAPNTVPYTSQLKQFQSGTLNSAERTYYSSNSNIKNTIDRYLIQKNFSNIAKFDAKLALEFSESLNLNFEQFNWVFNNRDSQDLNDIKDYLNEAINITSEIEDFVKDAIDALNNDEAESFEDFLFDEQIFIDKDFKDNSCLKSVYDAMGKTTKFKEYLQNFEPEFSVAHLRLKYDENFGSNHPDATTALAITDPPLNGTNNSNVANYNINITFNGDSNLDASIHNKPKLIIAVAFIHEMIHAEVFRKMLSAAQQGHLNTSQYTTQNRINYINSLRNNFEGIYDYYVERWKPDWGHQQMAQHYRNIIVGALKEFDNNQHTQAQYEAIAWLGLEGTIAWQNLDEDPNLTIQQEQDNIIQTRTNFINNDTDKCN